MYGTKIKQRSDIQKPSTETLAQKRLSGPNTLLQREVLIEHARLAKPGSTFEEPNPKWAGKMTFPGAFDKWMGDCERFPMDSGIRFAMAAPGRAFADSKAYSPNDGMLVFEVNGECLSHNTQHYKIPITPEQAEMRDTALVVRHPGYELFLDGVQLSRWLSIYPIEIMIARTAKWAGNAFTHIYYRPLGNNGFFESVANLPHKTGRCAFLNTKYRIPVAGPEGVDVEKLDTHLIRPDTDTFGPMMYGHTFVGDYVHNRVVSLTSVPFYEESAGMRVGQGPAQKTAQGPENCDKLTDR